MNKWLVWAATNEALAEVKKKLGCGVCVIDPAPGVVYTIETISKRSD